MEYVYPLSAMNIEDFVKSKLDLEKVYQPYLSNPKFGKVDNYKIEEILKEENIRYLDTLWTTALVFCKNSKCVGGIHKDGDSRYKSSWAINWIWGETGILDYWEDNQVMLGNTAPDDYGNVRITGKSFLPAEKTYIMTPGVYLVNTERFHRASTFGSGTRYALSVRTNTVSFNTWNEVVDRYSKIIISK
jgi:hypothetical protein